MELVSPKNEVNGGGGGGGDVNNTENQQDDNSIDGGGSDRSDYSRNNDVGGVGSRKKLIKSLVVLFYS